MGCQVPFMRNEKNSSAQKWPSGSALEKNYTTTEYDADYAGHFRTFPGYTGKITVYGAHSMYVGGKAYIKYSSLANA